MRVPPMIMPVLMRTPRPVRVSVPVAMLVRMTVHFVVRVVIRIVAHLFHYKSLLYSPNSLLCVIARHPYYAL
jgi:hypothetical protein